MPIPDDLTPGVRPAALSLTAVESAAVRSLAADHRISPATVVAAAIVAYRGPGPETATPRIGVAVSGGSRIAPIDLPVGARHSASGLVVRVGACVDSPVDPDPRVSPRDVVVAEGGPTDTTIAIAAVPVVLWCRFSDDGQLTLELATRAGSSRLDRHLRRFAEFLVRFVRAGRVAVGSLQIVTEDEHVLLDEWNDSAELLAPSTLVDLVEMGLTRDPDRAAIVTRDGVVTHGDIDCFANRIARALLASGVGPGAVVGVLCESAPAAMVAAVAVLRAGGAVLMLSTHAAAPETIVRIAEARATRVVTDSPSGAVVPPWVEIIALDDEELDHHPDEPITADDGARPDHLFATAEVTVSGFGDDLAALAHSHAALANRLQWTIGDWEATRAPGVQQVLVPADAHRLRDLCDVLWPLVIGATAHTTLGPGIDRITAGTGSVAEAGGAAFRVTGDERPGWNVEAYVLDGHLRVVPPGASGDLYVGGAQLALGWPRDLCATADHFVANPFRPGERMVRVGAVAARGGSAADDVDVLRRVVAAVGVFDRDTVTARPDAVRAEVARTDEIRPARSGPTL
ncbi:MAG: AMP-binding protein [Gordonia paraffinivorans]